MAATSLPLPPWGRGRPLDLAVRQRLLQIGDTRVGCWGFGEVEARQPGVGDLAGVEGERLQLGQPLEMRQDVGSD